VIETIARGLGLAASDIAAGSGGSPTAGWTTFGSIPLVPSMGLDRSSSYRGIYMTNPWVWAAVNMIARSVARLPIQVYDLDERGRKERIRGDVPLTPGRPTGGQQLDRLLDAPAGRVSRNAQMRATLVDRLVYGNALWEIERQFGQVTATPRIRWRAVRRVIEGTDGLPQSYVVKQDQRLSSAGSEVRYLAPDSVIHFGLGGDTEGPMGTSPLEACKNTLALYDAIMRHLVAYFGNSMQPSGNLKIDSVKLTRERAKEVRDMITELYASPENAGKILVSSGEFQSMTDTADHAQLIELVHNSREEIATTYAIPPPMLGILDRAIKSNVKELREQYIRDSVGPWANETEAEFQAQLIPAQPSWSSLFVEFQLAEQLRPDLEARALVYQRLMSVFAIDEIRSFENLAPLDIPGVSDVPWVQSGAMPITKAGQTSKLPASVPEGPNQPAGPGDTSDEALAEAVQAVALSLREPRQSDPELVAVLATLAAIAEREPEPAAKPDPVLADALAELSEAISLMATSRPRTDPALLESLEGLANRVIEVHLPETPRPRNAKATRLADGSLHVTYDDDETEETWPSQNGSKASLSS
jgi:HK97 family phage portal protein